MMTDDAFTIQILSHRVEVLEEQLATLELAHDLLDDTYCRSEDRNSALQDQVDAIPELNARLTRAEVEAQTANDKTALMSTEAGELRDAKTTWQTKAGSFKTMAIWGIVIASLEAGGAVAALTYWYLHPGLLH